MKVKDLFNLVKKHELKAVLNKHEKENPKIKAVYLSIYDKLKKLKPIKKINTDILKYEYDKEEKRYDFYLEDIKGKSYSTAFIPWKEIINSNIEIDNTVKKPLLLYSILWDMTFYGFDEKEIEKEKRKVKKIIKEIEEGKVKEVKIDHLEDLLK